MQPISNKFIVDESTGKKVAETLRYKGFDVTSVIESFRGASDSDITKIAFKENRIIITNDKDFGDLIYRKKFPAYGVIFLRLKDESAANKIRVILEVLSKKRDQLAGNFIVVNENSILSHADLSSILVWQFGGNEMESGRTGKMN